MTLPTKRLIVFARQPESVSLCFVISHCRSKLPSEKVRNPHTRKIASSLLSHKATASLLAMTLATKKTVRLCEAIRENFIVSRHSPLPKQTALRKNPEPNTPGRLLRLPLAQFPHFAPCNDPGCINLTKKPKEKVTRRSE